MDEVETKKSWYQIKQAVERRSRPGSFFEGVSTEDFSLVYDSSANGDCSAHVINCTLDQAKGKIICKPFTISNTCKEFHPKTELVLSQNTEAIAEKVLELFSRLSAE